MGEVVAFDKGGPVELGVVDEQHSFAGLADHDALDAPLAVV